VPHQIDFAEAWRGVTPIGERAYRNAAAKGAYRAPAAASGGARLRLPQRPVDGRRTHGQQSIAHLGFKPQMTMPLHRLDEQRRQRA